MEQPDQHSNSVSGPGSSKYRFDKLAPDSSFSNKSSDFANDEDSHTSYPVLTHVSKPVRTAQGAQVRRPSSAGAVSRYFKEGHYEQRPLRTAFLSDSTVKPVTSVCKHEAEPAGTFSDAVALSSSSKAHGEGRGGGSDSDNPEGQLISWRLQSQGDRSQFADSSFKSSYRGVSYDRKKRKWRVQIKVANLGKSGVSVGYFDTEEAAARAYDRAAIGLLGKDSGSVSTNFPIKVYQEEEMPQLIGKSREEVKATLKQERTRLPKKKFSSRQRTSKYMGVGSSNRKNQWQARILVHGKVTHLGYYETEEEAARVYDRVAISLNGASAQTNFPPAQCARAGAGELKGLAREDLQRALGVKPMDKSSQFRGVSRKKGKWEAKVMVNRKWAYRALFDSEAEAARAYDAAVWRLKPREAVSFVNFKDRAAGGGGKRPSRLPATLQRSKSQKLDSQSSAGSLPPVLGDALQLSPEDLEDLEDLDGPSTPSRRHSIQLPLSERAERHPLPKRQASAGLCLPSAAHASEVVQIEEELVPEEEFLGLGQQLQRDPHEMSPQHSAFSRRSSYTQLHPSLSGVALMSLPDPNSIGVPPPSDNLPYPELVGIPGQADTLEHSSSGSLAAHLSGGSSLGRAAGIVQSESNFPAIPPPLLPATASRLSMSGYFNSTPLSHGLSQAISTTHVPDFHPEEHRAPNPFQEASSIMGPIPSPSSNVLVRVGSETHVLQDAQPGLQKLASMTPSLDLFPQGSLPLSRMNSVRSSGLQRTASETVLRGVQVEHHQAQLPGLQGVSPFSNMPAGELVQQPSLGGSSVSGHNAVGRQASMQSPGVGHMPMPTPSPFDDYCSQEVAGQYDPQAARGMSHMEASASYAGGMRGCAPEAPGYGMLAGDAPMHRSMSTSSLMQAHLPAYGSRECMPQRTASSQLYARAQQPGRQEPGSHTLAQMGLPPLPSQASKAAQQDMGVMGMANSDAADLLAELGVDVNIPDCHSPLHEVQIGGEDLPF